MNYLKVDSPNCFCFQAVKKVKMAIPQNFAIAPTDLIMGVDFQ